MNNQQLEAAGMAMNASKPLIKGERRYPCGFPGCKWIFTRSNHVIRHHQRVHPGFNPTERPTSIKTSSIRNNNNNSIKKHVVTSSSVASNVITSPPMFVQSSSSLTNDNNTNLVDNNLINNSSSTSSSLLLQAMKAHQLQQQEQQESTKMDVKNGSIISNQQQQQQMLINSLINQQQLLLNNSNSNLLCNLKPQQQNNIKTTPAFKCDQLNCGSMFDNVSSLIHHLNVSHSKSSSSPTSSFPFPSSTQLINQTPLNGTQQHLTNASLNNLLKQLNSLKNHDNNELAISQQLLSSTNGLINPSILTSSALVSPSSVVHHEDEEQSSASSSDGNTNVNGSSILDLCLPKPHSCPFDACGKSFTRKDHLKRHILNFHVGFNNQLNHPSPPESPSSGELNLSIQDMNMIHGQPSSSTATANQVSSIPTPSSVSQINSNGPSSPSTSIPYVDIEPEVVLEVDESKIWIDPTSSSSSDIQKMNTIQLPIRKRIKSFGSVVIEEEDNNLDSPNLFTSNMISNNSFPNRFSFATSQQVSLRGKRPYMCDIGQCNKSYTKHSHLVRHKVETHKMKKPEPRVRNNCIINGAVTASLPRPVQTVHHSTLPPPPINLAERPYVCDFPGCKWSFKRQYHLDRHFMTHRQQQNMLNSNNSSSASNKRPAEHDEDDDYVSVVEERSDEGEQEEVDQSSHLLNLSLAPSPKKMVASTNDVQKQSMVQQFMGIGTSSILSPSPSPHHINSPGQHGQQQKTFDWSSINGRNSEKTSSPPNEATAITTFKCVHKGVGSADVCGQSFNSNHALQMHEYFVHSIAPRSPKSSSATHVGRSSPQTTTGNGNANVTQQRSPTTSGPKAVIKVPTFFKSPPKTASKTLSEFSLLAAAAADKSTTLLEQQLNNGITNRSNGNVGKAVDTSSKMSDDLMYILSLRNILKSMEEQQQQQLNNQMNNDGQTMLGEDDVQEQMEEEEEEQQDPVVNGGDNQQISLQQLQQIILMNTLLNGTSNQANNQLIASLIGNLGGGTKSPPSFEHNVINQNKVNPVVKQVDNVVNQNRNVIRRQQSNCVVAIPRQPVNQQPNQVEQQRQQKAVFSCDIPGCDKKFGRNCELTRHKLNHMDIWPFLCDYPNCGRKFKRKDVYKNHQRTHIKEDANNLSSYNNASSLIGNNSNHSNNLMDLSMNMKKERSNVSMINSNRSNHVQEHPLELSLKSR